MQDLRRIAFSQEELFHAFDSFSRKSPGFLPEGELISCTPRVATEDGCSIIVKMKSVSGEKELVYRDTAVLQALILFCIENNVMLPREGVKTFLVLENRATLIVELNLELDLGLDSMTTDDITNLKKK